MCHLNYCRITQLSRGCCNSDDWNKNQLKRLFHVEMIKAIIIEKICLVIN